ncbi:tRNA (adenosine(37)-N6)-threonylcarbamoyltransferase complex dimerization subunit type 1 TsaB [Psychrobacter sp. 2Y5]|uniref:tRNA (adenosine(37)-N6)-threonylcarbamoyltransferase complex dimerization subunit type 1 TsaB n=1 Tax=unclassified Psychrobacter TaxID=196806 RepID=UPI003F47BE98
MFLAMDTVFDQCSVAILDGEGKVVFNQTEKGKREQTRQILPMIEAALQASDSQLSDIQVLIFNRGPGAFSGIRINTAVVQALSVAHDLPCVGVSSLQAIAQTTYKQYGLTHVYSALDARMQQVYFGEYVLADNDSDNPMMQPVFNSIDTGVNEENSTERLMDYERQTENDLPIVGNGSRLLTLHADQVTHEDVWPDASIIGQMGIVQFMANGGTEAAGALPKYLRNQAWKTLKEQGKASGS